MLGKLRTSRFSEKPSRGKVIFLAISLRDIPHIHELSQWLSVNGHAKIHALRHDTQQPGSRTAFRSHSIRGLPNGTWNARVEGVRTCWETASSRVSHSRTLLSVNQR